MFLDLVAEGVLVLRVRGEAELVLAAALVAAGPVVVGLVRGGHAADLEEAVRGVAEAGLVHGAGARGGELARLAGVALRRIRAVLVVLRRVADRLRRGSLGLPAIDSIVIRIVPI